MKHMQEPKQKCRQAGFWLILIAIFWGMNCKTANDQLIRATYNRDKEAARQALNNGANVTYMPGTRHDAMYEAIDLGDLEMVQLLIDSGYGINYIAEGTGDAPLHLAAQFNRVEIMQYLLEKGADVNLKSSYNGETPIFRVRSVDALKLLLAKKPNVNARNNSGRTPLFKVASDPDLVKMLIANKANVNALDDEKQKPLSQIDIKRVFREHDERGAEAFFLLGGRTQSEMRDGTQVYPERGSADHKKNLCATYYSALGLELSKVATGQHDEKYLRFLKKIGARKDPRDGKKQKCKS